MKTKTTTKQEMTLLTAVEQIVELSSNSKLEPEFFRKAAKPIKYLAERLELTPKQAVLMALFIDYSEDKCINIRDLSRRLGCTTTRILLFAEEIDELTRRDMVRCMRERNGVSYRVPWPVVDAFIHNKKYEQSDNKNLTCDEFFETVTEIFGLREDNEINTETTEQRLQKLMDDNRHLIFVQQVKKYNLESDDEMLLLLFSQLFVNNNDDDIRTYDFEFLYDKNRERNNVNHSLYRGNHPLLEQKIVEYNNTDGFFDRESFRIADTAKQNLFPEINISSVKDEKNRRDIVKHEDIVSKQLYFDKNIEAQIADLTQLLDEQHYAEICNRLKDKGYRSGFTCLFYGAPGTGKTETVLQLARKTGRDIMQVNISQIKSCWVGESEKNIKKVFDTYRSLVDKQKVTPILLFNEADAIIGKRMENTERSVDKMENSIQNIILQEMETLKGILIATTNLVQNLDQAFERRFLYKIKFNKPTIEAREQIWHTMLPDLPTADISILAEKYNFSGGQIENIARHYTIDTILHSDRAASLATLISHCDNERLEKGEKRVIGFGN